jgi:hypothetical protein
MILASNIYCRRALSTRLCVEQAPCSQASGIGIAAQVPEGNQEEVGKLLDPVQMPCTSSADAIKCLFAHRRHGALSPELGPFTRGDHARSSEAESRMRSHCFFVDFHGKQSTGPCNSVGA